MSNDILNVILTSVIVPVLAAITPMLVIYLNKLAEDLKSKIKDRDLQKYINIAEDAVSTAVTSIMQTYVDAIKGTEQWTDEAKKKAFDQAKIQAITIMGSAARLALKEAYGDIDSWLNNKIESYVNLYKT